MLVLVYHSIGDLTKGNSQHITNNPLFVWIAEGHTGVSLFLVLSGFILTTINLPALHDGRFSYGGFLWNRFVRIFPLLIFMYVLAIPAHTATFKSTDILPLLLLQLNSNDSIGISSEWAVAIEFQCYLLFPFLLAFWRSNGLRYLGEFVLLVLITRLGLVAAGKVVNNGAFYFSLVGRLDQFIIGMIAAAVYARVQSKSLNWTVCLILILSAIICLTGALLWGNHLGFGKAPYGGGVLYPTVFHSIEAILWAVVLVGYLLLPLRLGLLERALSKLGEISYSLYLVHTLVILAVYRLLYPTLVQAGSTWSDNQYFTAALGTLILVIPLSLLVSYGTYRLIEKPFLQFRRPYQQSETQKENVQQSNLSEAP